MNTTDTMPDRIRQASDAVVEFAIISLQPEFLRWEKTVNMGMAELVWNGHSMGIRPPVTSVTDPALAEMIERLVRARTTRWDEEDFLVFGLDVRHRDDAVYFVFDLSWDEGQTCNSCEIEWVWNEPGPAPFN